MLSKKFELAGGVATGVLGVMLALVAPFVRYGSHTLELYTLWPGLLLGDTIAFAIPGLIVAIGSYLHSVARKSWGFVLVIVGGAFLLVTIPIHFFGGVFYFYGLWGAFKTVALGHGNPDNNRRLKGKTICPTIGHRGATTVQKPSGLVFCKRA